MDLPAEPQLRWILSRTADLLELGAEPVRGLVLPTGEFFPDRFDGSPRSLMQLLGRVQEHAGLADLKVGLTVVTPEGEAQQVSCASGACGGTGKLELRPDRLTQHEDGSYTILLGAGEIGNPVVLTTALARAIAGMFLTEADGYAGLPARDREALTDLAGVMLGYGVMLANGSYIYMKGCSGVSVHSATKMPVDEITVALGLFCRLFDVPERSAAKHLEVTPAEHFDEGYAWASSNAQVVRLLRKSPDAVRAGEYSLSPARSWLARMLGVGGKKHPRTPDEELAEMERAMLAGGPSAAPKKAPTDAAKAKKLAALKALVDENLES